MFTEKILHHLSFYSHDCQEALNLHLCSLPEQLFLTFYMNSRLLLLIISHIGECCKFLKNHGLDICFKEITISNYF